MFIQTDTVLLGAMVIRNEDQKDFDKDITTISSTVKKSLSSAFVAKDKKEINLNSFENIQMCD
ncbi:hypothetical protein MFLAVUS_004792 [Mucor flavus]|uniref:Uncharacterized protein n=1 Tax=Mucor flavus TaxID=439312 RepID=A0ABP9YWX5_9FUNG